MMKRPQEKRDHRDSREDAPRRGPPSDRGGFGGRGGDNYGAPRARPSFDGGDRPPRRPMGRDDAAGSSWNRSAPRFGDRERPRFADRERSPEAPRPAPAAEPAAAPRTMPVAGPRLKDGLRAANRAVAELLEGLGTQVEGSYDIPEIEVEVSFDQQGRFMGFGRGGAVTLKLTLSPLDAEDILTHANDDEDFDGLNAQPSNDDGKALSAAPPSPPVAKKAPAAAKAPASKGAKAAKPAKPAAKKAKAAAKKPAAEVPSAAVDAATDAPPAAEQG